jgi:predicted RecA/RadA family phage recombinase
MANEIALKTADKVEVIQSYVQITGVALEAITAGAPVRIDPTAGTIRNGNGSDMTEGKIFGIATRTAAAGEAITVLRRGIMDGFDLSALNYGVTIYASDTDARISGTAGTKAVTIGYVVPGHAQSLGSSPDKLLMVDPTLAAAIT